MRKFLSLLLTMAMVLSLAVTVNAAAPKEDITILHTNDVHCDYEKYAKVATLHKSADLLVDAGDHVQGDVIGTLSKGEYIVDIMNYIKYDAAVPGNHEFDYGMDQFLHIAKDLAKYPYLSANFTGKDGTPYFDAYKIFEVKGVKVAFVGVCTPETFTKSTPTYFQDANGNYIYGFCEGNNGADLYKAVQKAIDAAKAAGADYVIGLGHLGIDEQSSPWTSKEVIANTTGFDAFIDGHSHSTFSETIKDKSGKEVVFEQTGTKLANVGKIIIKADGTITHENVDLNTVEPDAEAAAYIQTITDKFDALQKQVVAKTSVELTINGADGKRAVRNAETNLGDLITDAMLWKIRSDATIKVPVENVVAITNGGGIRATVKAGDITKKDINTVLPFGNTLAVVYVTGAELLEALEASTFCTPESLGGFPQAAGLQFALKTYEKYDANPDPYPKSTYYGPKSIQRVTIDNVNGKAFDPTATYAVVTNNFVAGGGDTYYAFAAATDQFDTGLPLDEVVMEYITKELKGVIGEEYALPGDRIVRAASAEELEARGTFLENMSLLCDLTAYTEDSVQGVKAAYAAYKAAKTTEAVEAATADLLKAMPNLVFVPNTFTDAQSGWYKAAVDFAQASGLMNGMTATEFAPNVTTTRAMVAQVLYRLAGSPTVERTGAFADVAPGAWYYDAMLWASSTGILKGYEDGTYRPARAVSRQEMATILLRMADVKLGADLVDAALAEIADGGSVASWARAGVAFCYLGGIMNGVGGAHFDPTGMLTRAQLAQVFFNLYNIGMDEVMNSGEDPEPASSLLAA